MRSSGSRDLWQACPPIVYTRVLTSEFVENSEIATIAFQWKLDVEKTVVHVCWASEPCFDVIFWLESARFRSLSYMVGLVSLNGYHK